MDNVSLNNNSFSIDTVGPSLLNHVEVLEICEWPQRLGLVHAYAFSVSSSTIPFTGMILAIRFLPYGISLQFLDARIYCTDSKYEAIPRPVNVSFRKSTAG